MFGAASKFQLRIGLTHRNYVHPEKERSHGIELGLADAQMFWEPFCNWRPRDQTKRLRSFAGYWVARN